MKKQRDTIGEKGALCCLILSSCIPLGFFAVVSGFSVSAPRALRATTGRPYSTEPMHLRRAGVCAVKHRRNTHCAVWFRIECVHSEGNGASRTPPPTNGFSANTIPCRPGCPFVQIHNFQIHRRDAHCASAERAAWKCSQWSVILK